VRLMAWGRYQSESRALFPIRQPETFGWLRRGGVDGDAVHDVEMGCDKLARQICTPVDWMAWKAAVKQRRSGHLNLGPVRR
jgi:hypothetical protein